MKIEQLSPFNFASVVFAILFIVFTSDISGQAPPSGTPGATQESSKARIIGRVLNKDKVPVKDLRLQMAEGEVKDGKLILSYSRKTNDLIAGTDSSGRFQFSSVPSGKWAITVVYGPALTDDNGNPVLIVVEEGSSAINDIGEVTRR